MANEKKEHLYAHITETNIKDYDLPDDNSMSKGTRISATASDIKLKSGHNRHDTDFHRPEDIIPRDHSGSIQLCQSVYKKNGLVRNIIDLMADFASEGLDLRHPIKSQERFYKEWAKRVDLESRSHDFMRYLMRDANVVIRRRIAKITKPLIKDMSKAYDITFDLLTETVDETSNPGKPEKIGPDKKNSQKNVIPWGYTFISPVVIEKTGGPIGKFFGSQSLAMRLTTELIESIRTPKTDAEKAFIKKIPKEIIDAVKKGSKLVALDPDRMYIEYYKKDDWDDWATPFMMGVIEDILLKDKMKQADMAALDGVVNSIRLWKLGNSNKQILPTKTAVNKLLNILQHNAGGGVMDIVWDDMIDVKVEYPPIDKILGPQKYQSVDRDILKGLGVPDALVGGADSGTRNAQTAFVQLKTLVERLKYIRAKCIIWIQNELQLVADAMGFKKIPNITFETMSLRDETAEKQLMIQLLDRNIISIETIHKVFGNDFGIELANMKLENDLRDADPPIFEKASPYYQPLSIMKFQRDTQTKLAKMKNDSGGGGGGGGGPNNLGDLPTKQGITNPGRSPNIKDTKVRKVRTPRTLSILKAVAEDFIDSIDSLVDPIFLESNKTKNIRSLSKEKKLELQNIKLVILSNVSEDDSLNSEYISLLMANIDNSKINRFFNIFKELNDDYTNVKGRCASTRESRSLATSSWALLNTNE